MTEKDNERIQLRERINEVEFELKKVLDDSQHVMSQYEILKQEQINDSTEK